MVVFGSNLGRIGSMPRNRRMGWIGTINAT